MEIRKYSQICLCNFHHDAACSLSSLTPLTSTSFPCALLEVTSGTTPSSVVWERGMSGKLGLGQNLFGSSLTPPLVSHDSGCKDCCTCPLLSQLQVWASVALYSVHLLPTCPSGPTLHWSGPGRASAIHSHLGRQQSPSRCDGIDNCRGPTRKLSNVHAEHIFIKQMLIRHFLLWEGTPSKWAPYLAKGEKRSSVRSGLQLTVEQSAG